MYLNKIQLIGHVGKDAVVTNFEKGGNVTKFSLATTKKYTDKNGETHEQTVWHNIVFFGKSNKLAQFITKGKPLYIEGSINNRSYDKEDGSKGYVSEVVASHIEFLGGNDKTKGNDEPEGATSEETGDIPF